MRRSVLLPLAVFAFQVPIVIGYAAGLLPLHPIVIILPLVGLLTGHVEKRGPRSLGLTIGQPFGWLLALAFGLLGLVGRLLALRLEGVALHLPPLSSPLIGCLVKDLVVDLFIIALWEEVVNRGYIQTRLQAAWGFWGVVATTLLFACLHLPSALYDYGSTPEVLFRLAQTALAGFMLGYLYWWTASVLPIIALHGLRSFLMLSVAHHLSGVSAGRMLVSQMPLQLLWSVGEVALLVFVCRLGLGDRRSLSSAGAMAWSRSAPRTAVDAASRGSQRGGKAKPVAGRSLKDGPQRLLFEAPRRVPSACDAREQQGVMEATSGASTVHPLPNSWVRGMIEIRDRQQKESPVLQQLNEQIDRLKDAGALYVDARWYPFEETNDLLMWNGNLKEATASRESGVGVRVLYKGAWGFSAASDTGNLTAVFDGALDNARVAAERVTFPVRLAEKDAIEASFESPNQIDPFTVPLADKVAFMQAMDEKLNQPGVFQRVCALTFIRKQIVFLDSEGSEIEKTIVEVFPSLQVTGRDAEGTTHTRAFSPPRMGDSRGWETLDMEVFSANAERIVRELNEVLVADDCPEDVRSVILLPGIMFLQTHETIGHALELDRILGYELAYAGGSFVRLNDFGTLRYGSDKLTVRADATIRNSPGSFGFDDDGIPAQDNLLIDKGLLVGAITGRQMVEEANARARKRIFEGSSGANRATSFYRVPLERMTNINVDPGEDGTLDDIVSDTERGIILDGDRSWSIGSNREQFHFATEIGWLVEDGKVTRVVKNATYQGETIPFYNSLSAVGDESTWEVRYVPNCGKGQPNQIMQLGHGVPVCRFDNVRIGE